MLNWLRKAAGRAPAQKSTGSAFLDTVLADMFGVPSTSGVTVTAGKAERQATVYSCVNVLSESISMLPVKLYRQVGDARERMTDHHASDLLSYRPNGWQTPSEFKHLMVRNRCLRGNAYAWKNRLSDGRVMELVPLHPDRMEVKQKADLSLVYRYRGDNGGVRDFTADQILHMRMPWSRDHITGESPIRYGAETIGATIAAQTYGARVFKNGLLAGGTISTETLNAEQLDVLREEVQKFRSGLDNAFKILALPPGAKFEDVGISPSDAQLLDLLKFNRTDICGLFRVPPHKIGDLERATFSNIEEQELSFITNSLMAWLVRDEETYARALLKPEEQRDMYFRFTVNALLRGDMKSRADYFSKMINWGVMNPNEARALEEMNPREGGDAYLQPVNMTAVGPNGAAQMAGLLSARLDT